jgi:hypothetical protein
LAPAGDELLLAAVALAEGEARQPQAETEEEPAAGEGPQPALEAGEAPPQQALEADGAPRPTQVLAAQCSQALGLKARQGAQRL